VAGSISQERTPPAFLLCAHNDRVSESMANFFVTLKQADVNAELHVFNTGGHGFGVRSDRGISLEDWPNLFLRWLGDRGFLED
jgi:acetyl esterase/lipase